MSLRHLDGSVVVLIAPSFGLLRCRLERPVLPRRLDRPVLPRRLDRPVVGLHRCLDRPVDLIAPSLFESPRRRLDHSDIWIAPSLFGSFRRLDRFVVWIAPSFGSLRRLDRSAVV